MAHRNVKSFFRSNKKEFPLIMMYPPWIPQGYIKRIYFIIQKPSKSQLLNSIPILPFYSRCDNPFLLTGTGMENCMPKFWEREREWKTHSQTLGTGIGGPYSRKWSGTGIPAHPWPKIKHRHRRNVTSHHSLSHLSLLYFYFFTFITSKLPSQDDFHHLITFTTRKLSSLNNFHY